MTIVSHWELRSQFAQRLSTMYGTEVPAYNTLLDVAQEVNEVVARENAADAQRFGSIERVTAERHGAIRVGTPDELAQVSRVFGALGMGPVGFYDLRDASSSAIPVVSTAFRPIDGAELALNPFRVFTSMLASGDRRFFSQDLQERIERFLAARTLFAPKTLDLADRSIEHGGLEASDAEAFLAGAVASFEISRKPVDAAWYRELEAVSAVAADIAGVESTHINHLTPRVLDIDELYNRMQQRGVQMIDEIQGPPRWSGPDVLLRQTSFRALAEPRRFMEVDGSIVEASLRVRFGEVESRGIALTPEGRERYDSAMVEIDEKMVGSNRSRSELTAEVWPSHFPATEAELHDSELGYFTYRLVAEPSDAHGLSLAELVRRGDVAAEPIVYEDFLPRSAAGIFQSNLTDSGTKDEGVDGIAYDRESLSEAMGRAIFDPFDIYAQQSRSSRDELLRALMLDTP